jgi:hypothetical protein
VEPQQQKRILIALGAVVAAVAVVAGILALTGGDDAKTATRDTTSTSSTSSTSSSTSSTAPAATTTLHASDLDAALYPALSRGDVGFEDPEELVRAFALDVLGYDSDLVVGAFEQGDARSGEVELRPRADGAVTVVLVRKLADDSWAVIGAHTDSIRLDTPVGRSRISSPQPLLGAAQAFEGHVNVTLYADGQEVAIANTFVLGRGDQMGDFTGQLTFTVPAGATRGVLVLSAASGDDGSTVAATAIRVRF